MNDTKFKKALDHVQPDAYMESRMLENIKENPVRKKRFPLKKVICAVLCAAVFASGTTGIYYSSTFTNRPFSVMVVSASDNISESTELSENAVSFPQIKIEAHIDDDGNPIVNTDYLVSGFAVKGDDIDTIQYKSKNGYFIYYDECKRIYDSINRGYYSVVIPVSDEEANEINNALKKMNQSYVLNSANLVLQDYMKTHDLSEYFGENSMDIDDYSVEFSKCSDIIGYDNDPGYAFFLIDYEKDDTYRSGTGPVANGADTLTVQMYDIPQEELEKYFTAEEVLNLTRVDYEPEKVVDVLLDDPDMDKSKLPEDEITITVTFKDGKKARKVIGVSFNEKGEAQFAVK